MNETTKVTAKSAGEGPVTTTGAPTLHPGMARLLVGLQFVAIALLLWPAPAAGNRGLAVTAGLLGTAWLAWTLTANPWGNFRVRPEPKAGAKLATAGPYRWVRHPMYTGVLIMMTGAAIWGPLAWKAPVWLALAGILIAKARLEERGLLRQFPEYAEFRRSRKFLVPGIW